MIVRQSLIKTNILELNGNSVLCASLFSINFGFATLTQDSSSSFPSDPVVVLLLPRGKRNPYGIPNGHLGESFNFGPSPACCQRMIDHI